MSPITVEISPRWVAIIKSPLMYVIWMFQGVAVTFAPLFLYWSGRGTVPPEIQWLVVPLCFALVYIVPLFYFAFGNSVIKQLRTRKEST